MKKEKPRIWRFLPPVIFALHIPLSVLYFFGNFGKGYVGLWSILVLPLAMVYILTACFGRWKMTAFLSAVFAGLQLPPIWGWSSVGLRYIPAGPEFVKNFPGVAALCVHFVLIALALFAAKRSYSEGEKTDDVP